MSGSLFLIPVPLGDTTTLDNLPANLAATVSRLSYFAVENAKTARAHLKRYEHPRPLRELNFTEIRQDTSEATLQTVIAFLKAGDDVGLMSEAGCPAVADPGNRLVALAHAANIAVKPLVGPSSLLLALMGSGLNGQCFNFLGYLPIKEVQRTEAIRTLERNSQRESSVQLFIETPYRNESLFQSLLATCQPSTRLCIATNLTLPDEFIKTSNISAWQQMEKPQLDRRPTVFLVQA